MRPAFTLVELIVACSLIGLLAGLALPRMQDALDALRVRQAGHEIAGSLSLARAAAIHRSDQARFVVDEPLGMIRVEVGDDTLQRRALRDLHRVTLRASRDTITYSSSGLGYGISNSTIVVSLRQRAETVTVSRLGRMRRSWH